MKIRRNRLARLLAENVSDKDLKKFALALKDLIQAKKGFHVSRPFFMSIIGGEANFDKLVDILEEMGVGLFTRGAKMVYIHDASMSPGKTPKAIMPEDKLAKALGVRSQLRKDWGPGSPMSGL